MSTTTRARSEAPFRNDIVTDKLTQTRADLQDLLEKDQRREKSPDFPRSKTMKLLTSSSGIALLAIAAGAVLVMRPALASRVVRTVPMGAMLKSLAVNLLSRR